MPFKSKAQMAKFYAMEARGEIPKGTTQKWREHTPNIKRLPQRKTPAQRLAEAKHGRG